jgi:hypothetical protein
MSDRDVAKATDPPQECLTPGDRALLNAVFGWHMPGAALIAPSFDQRGKPVLIPLIAWVIADARRHGEVEGELTLVHFTTAAASIKRSPTQALHLTRAQIARGLDHLESVNPAQTVPTHAGLLADYLNAGKAMAAAG